MTATGLHWADLFPPGLLNDMLTGGYIRAQEHPTLPYVIYNYTEKAAYENAWNEATLTCRGLIVEVGTGRVVARPFGKFFNHGQPGAPTIPLDTPVHVTDKADGSLGILYPTPGGWAVATRGSFTSDQALHATDLLRTRYAHWTPRPEQTVLVEIVYPANRIVIDYAGLDDLILIGSVDTTTGAILDPSQVDWPGPAVTTMTAATLAEALTLPPRPNAEGVVVRALRTGHMLKIKQDDYVALHRIVTGLTARTVWQHLADGRPLAELIEPLPDEFHPWVRQIVAGLETKVATDRMRIAAAYDAITGNLPDGWTRKDFAALAVRSEWKWALFLTLDGRDLRPELWKRARPGPYLTPTGVAHTEDTA